MKGILEIAAWFALIILLSANTNSCFGNGKGLQWTWDGKPHNFSWGDAK